MVVVKNLKYTFSGSHFGNDGIIDGTDYQKTSVRQKTSFKKGIFDFNSNLSYTESKINLLNFGFRGLYEIVPSVPVYDSKNELSGYGLVDLDKGMPNSDNPVGLQNIRDRYNEDKYFTANFGASVEIIDGLKTFCKCWIELK